MIYSVQKLFIITDSSYIESPSLDNFVQEFYRILIRDSLIPTNSIPDNLFIETVQGLKVEFINDNSLLYQEIRFEGPTIARWFSIFSSEEAYTRYKTATMQTFNTDFDSNILSDSVSLTVTHDELKSTT
jgi:hypothetical protein